MLKHWWKRKTADEPNIESAVDHVLKELEYQEVDELINLKSDESCVQ